jgi:hypothetical protein
VLVGHVQGRLALGRGFRGGRLELRHRLSQRRQPRAVGEFEIG